MSQVTKTCHYITRSLTRPWEGDQRRLHFFDFDTGDFSYAPSATMFAENEINSQGVETWLDKTIENPLGACRKRLAAADPGALTDWKFYRAAALMLWLQGLRVRSISDQDARTALENLAKAPIEEIDQLVASIREEYDLCLVTTVADGEKIAPLYVPFSGTFQITFPDKGCLSGHAIGLGLPVDIHCALLVTPVQRHGAADTSRVPSSISNCSVGTSLARRVVVPPAVFDAYSEETLRTKLLDLRRGNDSLVSAVHEKQELVVEMFATTGLTVSRDGAGRVLPPAIS